MAYYHRKLLNETLEILITCHPYCNGTKNEDGACPLPCISVCFPTCNHPILIELDPRTLFPPPPPPPPYADTGNQTHKLPVFLTVFLAFLATAFFVFACYTYYKFCIASRRRHNRRDQIHEPEDGPDDFLDPDQGPIVDHPIWYIRTVGLQPSVISAITVVKYKRGDGLIDGTECSVCLNQFQEDEALRLLPKCNHAFHMPCIDTWLRSHTNCPLCRAGIVVVSTSTQVSQEEGVRTSGPVEEAQGSVSEADVGVGRETGGSFRQMIRTEGEGESRGEIEERKIVEISGELDSVQSIRRSVSMDSSSASVTSAAMANAFSESSDMSIVAKRGGENRGRLRLGPSSSVERNIQTGSSSSSIKRSLSCSAKVFLSRYSKSRNSGAPQ